MLQVSTSTIATFVSTAEVSREAISGANIALLDTLAVTIAGSGHASVRRLERALIRIDGEHGVDLPWNDASYHPDDAALLIGMASHILDYDDVSMLAVCHPSAPILSALLVAGTNKNVSGQQMLEALAIGTEVLIRLGEAMGFRHYALGFHASGTLGTVGAAAACARLFGLDTEQTAHAMSIAASFASGLRTNFGTDTKALHIGQAASNGLRAARLAKAGLTGAMDVFALNGFLHAFSGGEVDEWPQGLALGDPFAVVDPGFEQKRYPCCYMLHKIIEAVLAMRQRHDLSLDDMRRVDVLMPPGGTRPLIHPYPTTGLNALFSAPYAVVASLADGRINLGSFTDKAVMRPVLQDRLRSIVVQEADGFARVGSDLGSAPVSVSIETTDGRTLSEVVTRSPGSREDPIEVAQLREKWVDCLRNAGNIANGDEIEALFDEGLTLESGSDASAWIARVRRTMTSSAGE